MFVFCLYLISQHKSVLAATYFLQSVSFEVILIVYFLSKFRKLLSITLCQCRVILVKEALFY